MTRLAESMPAPQLSCKCPSRQAIGMSYRKSLAETVSSMPHLHQEHLAIQNKETHQCCPSWQSRKDANQTNARGVSHPTVIDGLTFVLFFQIIKEITFCPTNKFQWFTFAIKWPQAQSQTSKTNVTAILIATQPVKMEQEFPSGSQEGLPPVAIQLEQPFCLNKPLSRVDLDLNNGSIVFLPNGPRTGDEPAPTHLGMGMPFLQLATLWNILITYSAALTVCTSVVIALLAGSCCSLPAQLSNGRVQNMKAVSQMSSNGQSQPKTRCHGATGESLQPAVLVQEGAAPQGAQAPGYGILAG